MPTKINGSGEQQEYDENTGRYGESKTQWITTDRNYSKLQPKIIELDENNELAKLIATSDGSKYKIIRQYLIDNFGGEELQLPDGSIAVIDRSDAKELAHKADNKRTAELASLKRIIAASKYYGCANAVEHNKFCRFDYFYSTIKYKGITEQIWLNIGVSKFDNTYHLYSITPKKEIKKHRPLN
ncbi:MAG: hypothetical protein ACI4MZ_01305 [Christensenellales bacterium]